jgi:hypothetical protein
MGTGQREHRAGGWTPRGLALTQILRNSIRAHMISRSDWEPLPTPTLSPFALARPGTFLRVGFFTAAVWCVPVLCGCRWFIL